MGIVIRLTLAQKAPDPKGPIDTSAQGRKVIEGTALEEHPKSSQPAPMAQPGHPTRRTVGLR